MAVGTEVLLDAAQQGLTCEKCNSAVTPNDQFCIYCGTKVDHPQVENPVQEILEKTTDPTDVCGACGAQYEGEDHAFCLMCGAKREVLENNDIVNENAAKTARANSVSTVSNENTTFISENELPPPPKSEPIRPTASKTAARPPISQRSSLPDRFNVTDANEYGRPSCESFAHDVSGLDQLWVHDSFSNDCMDCGTSFGFPKPRRHHCRVCGLLFCRPCVQSKMQIPQSFGYGSSPQRCCRNCTIALQMKAINSPADVFNQRRAASSSNSQLNNQRDDQPRSSTRVGSQNSARIDDNNQNDEIFANKIPTQIARSDQKECQICFRQFAIGRRAHHCRRCTRSVCNGCSQGAKPIPEIGFSTGVRHCTNCMAKPPSFFKCEIESSIKPLPGFEFLSKLEVRIGVFSISSSNSGNRNGRSNQDFNESFQVNVYVEPTQAHLKQLNYQMDGADMEAANEYSMVRQRTFQDFEWLFNALSEQCNSKVLPNFPDKKNSSKLSEKKAKLLEIFLSGCIIHPIFRECEALKAFFGLSNEQFKSFQQASSTSSLKIHPEFNDILLYLRLKIEQDQLEIKLKELLARRKANETRVNEQKKRVETHNQRSLSQTQRRENANLRYEALLARKQSQEARMQREKERMDSQQTSVHILYHDTSPDALGRVQEEDIREREKMEFTKSKDMFQNDTTEWNNDMAKWTLNRANWSEHHNPTNSKQIANEWLVRSYGIYHYFSANNGNNSQSIIPKELSHLHVKVMQLQEEEPDLLESEGKSLDEEWTKLSKERVFWTNDRANMKREDELCADEDIRYKQEHQYVLFYNQYRDDKKLKIENNLSALEIEIHSREKAYAQRQLRHVSLDDEYEHEWNKSQQERMALTTERLSAHSSRIGRTKKRCETLQEQLTRQSKSQRLLLFKRAVMQEERENDVAVFQEHKENCRQTLDTAKSCHSLSPEYVVRLEDDVNINANEMNVINISNQRTPMEGDDLNVNTDDEFMNEVRAQRVQFQNELNDQLARLESELVVCTDLKTRIEGYITRLESEIQTAKEEEVCITEYSEFLNNEKKLISEEENEREKKRSHLTNVMNEAGNWVLDALHEHSKRKMKEADRLVKQALRAADLQKLVQHFTHRVIEQEERIMRQKQRILNGEHKLEMLKSSESWYLYVTNYSPDMGKHDLKCLEHGRKERSEDLEVAAKLQKDDESDVLSVVEELKASKEVFHLKLEKRNVWAHVEEVYNMDQVQEKDEDMMMTSQIRGLLQQLRETFEMLNNRLLEEEESLQHASMQLEGEVESITSFMQRMESEENALSSTEKNSLIKESQVRKNEFDLIEQRARALLSNYKLIQANHLKLPVAYEKIVNGRKSREMPIKMKDLEIEHGKKLMKTRNYYDRKACMEYAKKFHMQNVEFKEVREVFDWLKIAIEQDIRNMNEWLTASNTERRELKHLLSQTCEIDWSVDMLSKIPAFISIEKLLNNQDNASNSNGNNNNGGIHQKEQWIVELIQLKRSIASKDKELEKRLEDSLSISKKEESRTAMQVDKLKKDKEYIINTLRFIDQEEANAVRNSGNRHDIGDFSNEHNDITVPPRSAKAQTVLVSSSGKVENGLDRKSMSFMAAPPKSGGLKDVSADDVGGKERSDSVDI